MASDLADRDDQWDDREAIIFLSDIAGGFGPQLDAQFQRAGHFLLGLGASGYHDDRYSLHSDSERYWLPEVSPASTSGDAQEFLLDASSIPQTTTLGYVKQQIRDVTAELAGGDGSDAYRECVLEKYRYIRNQRNFPQVMGRPFTLWNIAQSIVSGQPSGTLLDQREAYGRYPDTKITLWLEGRDSALFSAEDGDSTAFDTDGDGQYDEIKYDEFVKLARPLPAGEYSFDLKESWPSYAPCNHVISNEWTVTATPPVGALHEFFFDPITDGAAVAADDTNGVLKPASFTDSNGASATINRIAWESSSTSSEPAPGSNRGQVGAVKLSVTPRAGLANHIVEFIELDGTLSLSLDPANATVDATTDTLSWAAASQPWEDGDKLMVRIREARPYAPAGLPRLRQ